MLDFLQPVFLESVDIVADSDLLSAAVTLFSDTLDTWDRPFPSASFAVLGRVELAPTHPSPLYPSPAQPSETSESCVQKVPKLQPNIKVKISRPATRLRLDFDPCFENLSNT